MRNNVFRGRSWRGLCAAAAVCWIAGCGSGGAVDCYCVSGSVQLKGRPIQDAIIVLHPLSSEPAVQRLRPAGQTAADGTFQLTTFEPNDGAPAGRYKVTIEWRPVAMDPRTGKVDAGPDRLQGRYADPDPSPLEATVEAEENNDWPPFEL